MTRRLAQGVGVAARLPAFHEGICKDCVSHAPMDGASVGAWLTGTGTCELDDEGLALAGWMLQGQASHQGGGDVSLHLLVTKDLARGWLTCRSRVACTGVAWVIWTTERVAGQALGGALPMAVLYAVERRSRRMFLSSAAVSASVAA